MKETLILEKALKEANRIKTKKEKSITSEVLNDVNVLIEKIDNNKSLVTALVTSLLKKIINPEQDIRLHRKDFSDGYSARVLDTKVTTPFFKRHFPKYANKETAFLTLATREKIKWNLKEGNNLKIRDKNLKTSFLNIFNQIETQNKDPYNYLLCIFLELLSISKGDKKIFQKVMKKSYELKTVNINIILEMLNKHFSQKRSSRLPVIAIFSIYEILMPLLSRYSNKKLVELQAHTSSDKHGYGDIEIIHKNKPFEIVEIKHNIPITEDIIFDIAKKTEKTEINRYYVLTTFNQGFENSNTEKSVNRFIMEIKSKRKIDIIANGILTTLKYYLRFVDDYDLFINTYTHNLVKDAKLSTEIKTNHIKSWSTILDKYNI